MHLLKNKKLIFKILLVIFIIAICVFAFEAKTLKNKKVQNVDSVNSISAQVGLVQETKVQGTYHMNKSFDLVPNDPKGDKNIVLITIDDGPTKYAESMMNTLDKHNAKAIFFINGIHVKGDLKDILKTEVDRGFIVGNHTWSHPYLKKISLEEAKIEIDRNTKIIEDGTGIFPRFFRAPFGESTQEERDYIKGKGMLYMNWSGSVKDWEAKSKNKDVFMSNVMKDLHPGEIILIHEHKETDMYLDELLTEITSKGYIFLDPKNITN